MTAEPMSKTFEQPCAPSHLWLTLWMSLIWLVPATLVYSDEQADWIERLAELRDHNSTAFGAGAELVGLDAELGLNVAQEAWPDLANAKVKTGLLKAFHFSKALRSEKHAHVLQVLNLGMTDSDQEVKQYAATYLKEYAMEDLGGDSKRYAAWYRQYGAKPPDEVVRLNKERVPAARGDKNGDDATDPLADVADVPAQQLRAGGNAKMRYYLVGPRKDVPVPEDGFKLLVVMPGGDGSADFHPFVRRIYQHALGEDFLVAQPVAVKWKPDQRITWPTKKVSTEGQKFSTEEFVAAVIDDVGSRHKLDTDDVYLLAWSSAGPAAYATMLQAETPAAGALIAMSVFKPEWFASFENATDRSFYLFHSPDDRTCSYRMASAAEKALGDAGARITLVDYEGGHGWRGDVFGNIRGGVEWLQQPIEDNAAGE